VKALHLLKPALLRLADVKESNPIEVAKHSVAGRFESKPAFAWWVDFTLKK
jgi:hypothetical protein